MSVQEEQQVSELAEKDKLAVDRLTALFDDGAFTCLLYTSDAADE